MGHQYVGCLLEQSAPRVLVGIEDGFERTRCGRSRSSAAGLGPNEIVTSEAVVRLQYAGAEMTPDHVQLD
jgi:hypothetical protein